MEDTDVPLEVLERRLTTRAAQFAAAEAEWMDWLAEYDRRRGWAEWGCSGPAHWLSWKCAMSPSAARERVRVATALTELPKIAAEFRAGRLSYSKVQALTRVANPFNEDDLVTMAGNATGAQLSRICAGYRASRPVDEVEALLRRGWTKRRHHDGTTSYTLRVLDTEVQRVDDHVERVVDGLIDDAVNDADDALARREVVAERGGLAAVRADAVVALLTGDASAAEPTPADLTLVVEEAATDTAAVVGADGSDGLNEFDGTCAQASVGDTTHTCAQVSDPLVAVEGGGQAIPPNGARRLLCDPRIRALVESAETGPLAVGRSTRLISRRLRRALRRRDGGCRFPGCPATQRLHAHHIVHWADGGPTDLDNLILLCHFHHHLVHEGGWSVDPASHTFRRPDRTPVDPLPDHLRAGAGPIEPTTWEGAAVGPLEPPNISPFDLPWTTAILHHNEALRQSQALTMR